VMDFLSFTDVGRLVPAAEEDDAGSDVSEWELRERKEREEERREEAEVLGAGGSRGPGRDYHCRYPPRPSWHRQTRSRRRLCFSVVLSFAIFLGARPLPLGTGLGGGQRACNEPPRTDCGQERDCTYASP